MLTGKDPITKFLRRNRKIKKIIKEKDRPSKEDIFNDPRKTCAAFIETLEKILDDATTDGSESEDKETEGGEEKTEAQLEAERRTAATHSSTSITADQTEESVSATGTTTTE